MSDTVVLGVGNLLLGDEGVGVHAARALLAGDLHDAEVLDVGTAILDALPALERARFIVVIDAVEAGGTPARSTGSPSSVHFPRRRSPGCTAST